MVFTSSISNVDLNANVASASPAVAETNASQVQILRLNGRFDAYEVPAVAAFLNEKIDAGQNNLVVNLSNVGFIDSAALSTLVQAMKRARQSGGDCRLCALQQSVRIIFELTRLDRAFQIFSDEAVATQSYALQPVF